MFSLRGLAMSLIGLSMLAGSAIAQDKQEFRRLSVKEYLEKMESGWVGKMVGVEWGAPHEFAATGTMIPEARIRKFAEGMANKAFGQDDLYVQMTFLRTLDKYGIGVSDRQVGIDFANSRYGLAHANDAGRSNLRRGIAPPDSGHPQFTKHADDIDYQIECEFIGFTCPGMANAAIELGDRFGHVMNYGDGVYGGQFLAAMASEAFFESDPLKLVEHGLKCIPQKSQYAECIRDTVTWWKENPADYAKTWQLIQDKYQKNPAYRKASCDKGAFNIDAKINGAYVVMGLLYGKGDLEKSMIIAIAGGQDSDCNSANVGAILFANIPFSKLPEKYSKGLSQTTKFNFTDYNFPELLAATEKVARQAVVKFGGKIEKDAKGEEVFVLPVQTPKPGKLEQTWEPGPIANSKFAQEEMKQINGGSARPR